MKTIYKYILILIISILLLCLVVFYFEPIIKSLMNFNNIYSNALDYYPYFAAALIAHVLASLYGFPLSNIYGNAYFANVSIVFASMLYFILVMILYINDFINIKSLLISMILSECFLFIIRLTYFRIYQKKSIFLKV